MIGALRIPSLSSWSLDPKRIVFLIMFLEWKLFRFIDFMLFPGIVTAFGCCFSFCSFFKLSLTTLRMFPCLSHIEDGMLNSLLQTWAASWMWASLELRTMLRHNIRIRNMCLCYPLLKFTTQSQPFERWTTGYMDAAKVTPVSLPEHAKYKYLLHLDGTSGSNRLLKLLLMGSVVLKQETKRFKTRTRLI